MAENAAEIVIRPQGQAEQAQTVCGPGPDDFPRQKAAVV